MWKWILALYFKRWIIFIVFLQDLSIQIPKQFIALYSLACWKTASEIPALAETKQTQWAKHQSYQNRFSKSQFISNRLVLEKSKSFAVKESIKMELKCIYMWYGLIYLLGHNCLGDKVGSVFVFVLSFVFVFVFVVVFSFVFVIVLERSAESGEYSVPVGRLPVGWERTLVGSGPSWTGAELNRSHPGQTQENRSQYGPRSRARSISAAALFDFQQRVREVFGKDTERCEVVDVCHSR